MRRNWGDERQDWNINKGMGDEIQRLITNVNTSSQLSLEQWNSDLRILYRNIEGHPKVERKVLEEIDKKQKLVSVKLHTLSTMKTSEMRKRQEGEIKMELDDINISLMREINLKIAEWAVKKKEGLAIYNQ